ncbi:MAG TPA: PAS-domain containing protein, partial [Xanthobacteraceae bacterium]
MRQVRQIVYLGMLITAAIAAAGGYAVFNLRGNILADTGRGLQNVTSVVAEHFERTFEALTPTQRAIAEQVRARAFASPEAFEAGMAGRDINAMLADKAANLLPVHALLLVSARGRVVNASSEVPVTADDVQAEDYFKELQTSPGIDSAIGAPTRNRDDGAWSFSVAYRIDGSDGRTIGLLVAVMELSYFERLFSTINVGPGSSVALVRRDGRLLVRFPKVDMSVAHSFGGNALFRTVLPQSGKGVVRLTSILTGQERLLAGQKLGGVAAAVSVGMDDEAALAGWRKGALEMTGMAVMILLVIGGMIVLCAGQVGEALNRQRFRLDTALEHMSHGLCMFDAHGALMVLNARYLEIYNITSGLIHPGLRLRELLARLEQAGIVTGDQDKYAADLQAAMAAGETTQFFKELKDGRTISIRNRPLPEGGWVATHEDVTERLRDQRRVQEANAYLRDVIEAMPAGLIIYDAEDRFVLCNRRFDEAYPQTADLRVPGIKFEDLLRAGFARGAYQEAAGREDEWIAARLALHVQPSRSNEQLMSNGRWLRAEDCRMSTGGFIGVRVDVTELKQREEELRLQNLKFDAALQNMSQGLVMFDAEGKLIVCNQRYARLYGLPPEMMRPGITHKQILEHHVAVGIIPAAHAQAYVADRLGKAASRAASDTILELSDGRTLLVAMRPTANGGWVTTHEDITARRQAETQIVHMAHHDALTNLPNRVLLRERLEEALGQVRRGGQLAVLYLDLDHFKSINDTLGHAVGDELLKAVATRLRGCVRETDTIARLGGDEFAIIQTGLVQLSDAAMLAARIRDAITTPYELDGHQVPADVSIGISIAPNDTSEPDQLLKNADMALYRSKADGRGTFRFFAPEMDERVKARRTLELDLRRAIVNGEFELYYQPLINLERHAICGCETLLRWHHPERGMVPPVEFIPVAEETGLINQIGEWVLRQACIEAATWPDDIAVAVNLSPVQFKNQNLALLIVSALGASGLPARRLEVEITEAVLLQNNEATLATLHQLRDLGVHIAMDDFGTGYSSLSYLRSFPFDKIKIDRSFISDIA